MPATWLPITSPWIAANGAQVIPVTSDADMATMGQQLRNGLVQDWARAKWADLCVQGRRQVLLIVSPEGAAIGNSFLRANPTSSGEDSVVEALFVRGRGAEIFAEGDLAFDAVTEYVTKLNAGELVKLIDINGTGFVQPAVETQEADAEANAEVAEAISLRAMTPIERAAIAAADLGISPIEALLQGYGAAPEEVPEPEPVEPPAPRVWAPLSVAFAGANGWYVAPTSGEDNLRRLGEELDNMLFPDGALQSAIAESVSGRSRFVAVEDTNHVIRGYAQFACVRGQAIITSARGYCDARLPDEGAEVLREYVTALYGNNLALTIGMGANGFSEEPVSFADALAAAGGVTVMAGLPRIQGATNGGDNAPNEDRYDGDAADGDEDEDEDEIGDEGDRVFIPAAPALEWRGIAAPWVNHFSGLRIEAATDDVTLRVMGDTFGNALRMDHYREGIARQCADGSAQVIQVFEGDTMVANGFIKLRGDVAYLEFLFGPGGDAHTATQSLPPAAPAAVAAWIDALNGNVLEMQGSITNGRFSFEHPAPRP